MAARYDPARMSPQRLAQLSNELKTNGKISSTDQQLMQRVAAEARDSDSARSRATASSPTRT